MLKGTPFQTDYCKNGDRPSTSGVLDVEFIDPMTGLIGVTVPPWF